MSEHIFRSSQSVRWSEYAFDSLGKSWLRVNYGIRSFTVVKVTPVKKNDRVQVGHKQLVTIDCDNGSCQIPLINQAKAGKCKGNCLITYPGNCFKPAKNSRKKKRRKTSK